jgi:hypothetical protein
METYTRNNAKLMTEQGPKKYTVRNFIICSFYKYYYGYQNNDKMGHTYSMYGGRSISKILVENFHGRHRLADLGTYGKAYETGK